jgi:hypothetical protein
MKTRYVTALVVVIVLAASVLTWLAVDNTSKRTAEAPIAPASPSSSGPEAVALATVTVSGLTFDLPEGWEVQSVVNHQNAVGSWDEAKIKVPDSKYSVVIPFDVVRHEGTLDLTTNELLKTLPSGDKIYGLACAPALACYYLDHGGIIYAVSFNEPESNQPVPDDLDGPWFPDTTVTEAEMLGFVATVK